MSRRKATKSNTSSATNGDTPDGRLTPQQCTAVDLLVSGKTLTDTAEAIGVGRPAVSDWVNHYPPFIAALNSRRQELWGAVVDELRGMVPKALAVLKAELEGDTPLQAAIQVLKAAGLYGALGPPAGPVSEEEVEHAQRQREIERIRTALTPEDITLAEQRRRSDRTFVGLTLFP